MGEYECDDGNIIDGDGCDHNCKKEENAICKLEGLHNSCLLPNYSINFEEGVWEGWMEGNGGRGIEGKRLF